MGHSDKADKFIHHHGRALRGVSLIEVLVGVVLASIIVLALYEVLTSQDRVYSLQDDIAEMQQNLRVGIERISRDLTMAGFGKPAWSAVNNSDLSSWYNSGNSFKPVNPVSGNSASLDIIGCLDAADGILSTAVSGGTTNIALQTGEGVNFNISPGSKSDINIGGQENAKVTGIAGNVLTIDTDPATSGDQGLVNTYGSGTEVYIVRLLRYSTGPDSHNVATLKINENRGAGNQPLCQYVSGMSISVNGNVVDLTLNGRTRNPDRTTGQYVTLGLSTRVFLRNP